MSGLPSSRFALTIALGLSVLLGFAMPLGDAFMATPVANAAPMLPQNSGGALSTEPASVTGTIDPSAGGAEGGAAVSVTLAEAPGLTAVAAGDGFGVALTDGGEVAAWGAGALGQLGDGGSVDSLTPVLLSSDAFGGERVTELAAGAATAYALTEQGRVYAWGAGEHGELTSGTQHVAVPTLVEQSVFGGEQVTWLAASGQRGYAVTESGAVYVWGADAAPAAVAGVAGAARIAAAGDALLVLTSGGAVLSVQLGAVTPVSTAGFDGSVIAVGTANGVFGALTDAGSVFQWVADGDPAQTAGVTAATQLAGGGDALIAASDAAVWRLAPGAPAEAVDLSALAGAQPGVLAAGAGTAFVVADGSVYAWGDAADGRLGTGVTTAATVPQLSVNLWPTQVRFGEDQGTDTVASSRTSIDTVSPAHDAGVVDLSVDFALRAGETAGLASLSSVASQAFTFEAAQSLDEQSSTQSLTPEFSTFSLIAAPPNDAPIGSGPAPIISSSMDPTAYTIPSGTTRTFTVIYENEQTNPLTNARLWHQIMSRGDHSTDFTVTCSSEMNGVAGGLCPDWVPSGVQSIPDGVDHEYYLTYAGIFTFAAKQKLTFTIAVTTTVDPAACTEDGSAMSGGWARYSSVSFEVEDIEGSASSVGAMSGWTVCPPGDIVMVNTVTSPRPPGGAPSRVLSGDPRTFEVSWQNVGSTAYNSVDLSYSYYVPYTRQSTVATWTCTATGPSTVCPPELSGSGTIVHNNPGEDADTVFSGTADFAPGQKYTLTVTLATTINTCTQDGYLRVQSYANRAAIGSETQGRTKSSELVEIGCSTWMLGETFSGPEVSDPGWKGLSAACLTAAPSGSTATNGLGYCSARNNSPAVSFQMPTGTPKGFLQLTDDSNNAVGAALYNRALPSEDGLVVEFTTYQYGNDAEGADGIGFFLADGAYNLTQPGDSGGALGYAYRPTGTSNVFNVNGLAHGYLGIGFDVYGNFVNSAHAAPDSGCTPASTQKSQSVALRGPGNLRTGYCLIEQNRVSNSPLSQSLDYPSAGISGTSGTTYDNGVRTALTAAQRKVRVTVFPLKSGETLPRVTVEIDFNEGFYRTVIDATMTAPAPSLIKFGFLGSTGGSKQVHLISDVRVGTVLQMKELGLVKAVDYDANADPTKTRFDVGDTVNYQFVVHNGTSDDASGVTDIYNIAVTDPLMNPSSIWCPKTTLLRNESMVCKGSLVVTEAQRDLGRIVNTATVKGAISEGSGIYPLTDRSTVEVPVNPEAPPATRVIAPGGTATFQVMKHGSTLGIVKPDDPARLKLEVWNGAAWVPAPTSGSTNISATNGTWTIDSNNKIVFVHSGTNYSDATLQYRVSNVYGGWAENTLTVKISIVPTMVCSVDQRRASDRYWGFGTAARFDFGTTGTAPPTTGTIPNVASTHGSFTVTDSKGDLLFVVTAGTGATGSAVIRTSTGAVMSGTGATIGNQLFGASPVTVIPAGQGTGKFIVITSSATSSVAGQLSWRMVDMTASNGLGSVGSPTAFGTTSASMAVTAVPHADGVRYWVVSTRRASTEANARPVDAHLFNSLGFVTGSTVTTSTSAGVGTGTTSSTINYEDLRFNAGLANSSSVAQFAALAFGGTNNAGTNRVRLMSFNAATGAMSSLTASQTFTRSPNTYGYSVEFSPNGLYLYASRIGNGSVAGQLFRATVSTTALGSLSTHGSAAPSSNNGGAVRLGANGYLYWAQTGTAAVRVKTNPNVDNTMWGSQSLASGSTSTLGLSNTLVDCAISPAEFALEKYASDGTTLVGGAAFALYTDVGGAAGTVVSPGIQPVSGQTGKFTATGITPGAYWLRETTAAAGHQLLAQDVLINVLLGGEIVVDTASNPQVQLVVAGTGNNKTYTIKVTDAKMPALPLTGGNWMRMLTIGGAVVLMLAIAGTIWWRRRREQPGADPAGDVPL